MDWLGHPLVVATYAAFLALLIALVQGAAKLWFRVGDLERMVKEFDAKLEAHMREEEKAGEQLRDQLDSQGRRLESIEYLIRNIGRDV